jgi:hypothetical protein
MNAQMKDRPAVWSRSRLLALALCGIALSVFVGANAHLIAVSFSSQPDCVPHLRSPQAGAAQEGATQFRAAMSSC